MLASKIKKHISKKSNLLLIFFILLLIIIRGCDRWYSFNRKYKELYNYKNINVQILNLEKIDENKVTYLVKYDNEKFLLNLYNDKNYPNVYNTTAIINVTVKLSEMLNLNNPHEFNFKRYLNSNNIVGSFNCYTNAKVIKEFDEKKLNYYLFKFKNFLNYKLEQNMDKKHYNFFKSMIYSDDLFLDEAIKEDFKECGASFLLTTSGTHVTYLLYVLNMFFKKESKIKNFLFIFILIVFCALAEFKASILRAVISQIIFIILNIFDKKKSSLYRLFLAFIIMISYNIYYIFNSGFILSFTCVLSIFIFLKLISSYITSKIYINKFKKYAFKKSFINLLIKLIINTFSLNLAVFIGTFVIQINLFSNVNILSIFSNVILSIVCSFEYFLGFLTLIFSISDILIRANYIVLEIIIKLVNIFSNYSLKISLPKFSIIEVILYYLIIGIYLYKIYYIKKITKVKRKKKKIILNILAFTFSLIIIISYIYKINFKNYIIFFNVGQGNMALIRQNKKTILIDSGSTSSVVASNILESYLKGEGISSIDLVLITHFHLDHVNGIYNLDKSIQIKNIAYKDPKEEFDTNEEYNNIKKYITENNINYIELENLDILKYDNLIINVLMPEEVIFATDIANANSTIFLISQNSKNYLFMGDATKESEEYYLKVINEEKYKDINTKLKNIYLYQVGHHGSNTSSSEEFLKTINPEIAIISSRKKVYSHPSKETLQTLDKLKISYYITEVTGSIKF